MIGKAKQFMECVWELTAYTYPESIALPHDYQVTFFDFQYLPAFNLNIFLTL